MTHHLNKKSDHAPLTCWPCSLHLQLKSTILFNKGSTNTDYMAKCRLHDYTSFVVQNYNSLKQQQQQQNADYNAKYRLHDVQCTHDCTTKFKQMCKMYIYLFGTLLDPLSWKLYPGLGQLQCTILQGPDLWILRFYPGHDQHSCYQLHRHPTTSW